MQTNYFLKGNNDTIAALATPGGVSAIAMIRLSGGNTLKIIEAIFKPFNTKLSIKNWPANTAYLGSILDGNSEIDEVVVTLFRNPHSYTGEDLAEISCHGSLYILQQILQLLINNGARTAYAGEFTMRAFLNHKMDLSQAEAVGDIIIANSGSAHKLALQQMKGGFSKQIKLLRQQLVEFTALLELELDFSEEDVEFANRQKLQDLIVNIVDEIKKLKDSFSVGNVIKNGIPVAIIGKPNVGKSTLLNALLNEERAIVSEIPGTTRDAIEDVMTINGIAFRFIDTAGLRHSADIVENIGIERTFEKIEMASVILYLFDVAETSISEVLAEIKDIKEKCKNPENKKFILIANKIDKLIEAPKEFKKFIEGDIVFISAKRNENIHLITENLLKQVATDMPAGQNTIITNSRHYEALSKAYDMLLMVQDGLQQQLTADLLTSEIRNALYYLGEITGEVTTDEILQHVFANFCIGK